MYSERVYAHRGFWNQGGSKVFEPNSREAIQSAIQRGFSVETDIRDYEGSVFVGHDPLLESDISLKELLSFKGKYALNVKADGLSFRLSETASNVEGFYFDMSIPEYQNYLSKNLKVFGRLSEYESRNQYIKAEGFWIDGFLSDWWCNSEYLDSLKSTDLNYVFVSPELHQRAPSEIWKSFAPYFKVSQNFALCTDHPDLFLELL